MTMDHNESISTQLHGPSALAQDRWPLPFVFSPSDDNGRKKEGFMHFTCVSQELVSVLYLNFFSSADVVLTPEAGSTLS